MPRFLKVSISFAVVIALGVATGSVLAQSQDPQPADVLTTQRPVDGSHRIGSQADDPQGGAPWAVRTYLARDGSRCYEVGQMRGAEFGRITAGMFRAVAEDQPSGLCGDVEGSPLHALVSVQSQGDEGHVNERSAISGLAGDDVIAITVTGPDGSHELRPGADGSFLHPFPKKHGVVNLSDLNITVQYADGVTRRLGPS